MNPALNRRSRAPQPNREPENPALNRRSTLHILWVDPTLESSGGSVAGAASVPTTLDFVIPECVVKAGMKPRHAVQLVDALPAPPGEDVPFVSDPSGQLRAYLATVNKPLKVIGVGGTFR